ncbi:MAG: response regulator transcription factor, partial [Deefgea sp.]
ACLTPREREVMKLILTGRLNKQIADDLSISMKTVEVHRARILEKMQVKTAMELAARLRDAGVEPQ